VVIAGGGPGGLLAGILLSQMGISTTILEKSSETEQWSSRSFSLFLKERGIQSLKRAECHDLVLDVGLVRSTIVIIDGRNGEIKVARPTNGISLSRPLLVETLQRKCLECTNVTLKRGAEVSKITRPKKRFHLLKSKTISSSSSSNNKNLLTIHLKDGSKISATHIIGADGKWSKVRQSLPEIQSQSTICTEPSFGIKIDVPFIPDKWNKDASYVFSASKESNFYIIASPMPNDTLSISIVCFDKIVESYPWLQPEGITKTKVRQSFRQSKDRSSVSSWEEDATSFIGSNTNNNKFNKEELVENLASFFEEEVPFLYSFIGKESLENARINQRTSWLKRKPTKGKKDVTYTSNCNRVTLIGDAAHAVTPSIGEGGNLALESAVRLIDEIQAEMKAKETTSIDVQLLSDAFGNFGKRRPAETIPIQLHSANASRFMR